MITKLSQPSIEKLLKVPDYRSFMTALIMERKKVKPFGYSHIARAGGFLARSFPRDVILGKKRITLTSLPKFIKGLGLNSDMAEYFKILVEMEEPQCRIKNYDITKLRNLKNNLQKRIYSKNELSFDTQSDLNFVYSSIPKIYAALGEPEVGATVREIVRKTLLAEADIQNCLKFMSERKLIRKVQERYLSTDTHINFQNLKTNIFQKHFNKTAEEAIMMSKKHIQSNEKLFLSSSFSVSNKNLPKLKDELREVILKYVDQAEDPKGDKVINLITSLY